jgi:hypothetical protein
MIRSEVVKLLDEALHYELTYAIVSIDLPRALCASVLRASWNRVPYIKSRHGLDAGALRCMLELPVDFFDSASISMLHARARRHLI